MAREYVCPGKIDTFGQIGIDLVIGKREGPYIFDTDGKRLIDLHINGGVFNLGHRHPELIAILMSALEKTDIGNHHFASEARALLARKLAEKTPGDLHYTVFAASGSEAVDIAIKTARWATQRRQIVSLDKGYHGSTGISGVKVAIYNNAATDTGADGYIYQVPGSPAGAEVEFTYGGGVGIVGEEGLFTKLFLDDVS